MVEDQEEPEFCGVQFEWIRDVRLSASGGYSLIGHPCQDRFEREARKLGRGSFADRKATLHRSVETDPDLVETEHRRVGGILRVPNAGDIAHERLAVLGVGSHICESGASAPELSILGMDHAQGFPSRRFKFHFVQALKQGRFGEQGFVGGRCRLRAGLVLHALSFRYCR